MTTFFPIEAGRQEEQQELADIKREVGTGAKEQEPSNRQSGPCPPRTGGAGEVLGEGEGTVKNAHKPPAHPGEELEKPLASLLRPNDIQKSRPAYRHADQPVLSFLPNSPCPTYFS